jgi:hypothetical protein
MGETWCTIQLSLLRSALTPHAYHSMALSTRTLLASVVSESLLQPSPYRTLNNANLLNSNFVYLPQSIEGRHIRCVYTEIYM